MNFLKNHSYKLLWGFIFIYIILFSYLSLKKYYGFEYNGFDLAIFNQVFFNTANGRWFDMSINLNSYLADHFTPIILLLVPIYKLWPKPETLLVLQSVVLGLSAWPLYKITDHVSKDKIIALGVALLWLINPFVHRTNFFEFHLIGFAAFLIFWTFYYYQKNDFKRFSLFFILSLIVREDISLILMGFFILSFLDKKTLHWKLISSILPITYFVITLKIIQSFSPFGQYKFLAFYGWLGGKDFPSVLISFIDNPMILLSHIFYPLHILYILLLLAPLLFIPLLKPRYLLFLLITFTSFLLHRDGFFHWQMMTHYTMFLLPALFISFIFGISDLKNNKKVLGVVILTAFYITYFISPVKGTLLKDIDQKKVELKNEILATIPVDASLLITANMITQVSNRATVYLFRYHYTKKSQFFLADFNLPLMDYIFIDYEDFISQRISAERDGVCPKELVPKMAPGFRESFKDYSLIRVNDNLLLWQDKAKATEAALVLYEIEERVTYDEENLELIVEQDIELNEGGKTLSVVFHSEPVNRDYFIRFYKKDYYYDLVYNYGLFNYFEWAENKFIRFFYYLDNDVDSYQIFEYSAVNYMNETNRVEAVKEIESITEIIDI